MSKVNLKDNEIHDLTMFVLTKVTFQHTPQHGATVTNITDEAVTKYTEVFNRIKSKNEKHKAIAIQV